MIRGFLQLFLMAGFSIFLQGYGTVPGCAHWGSIAMIAFLPPLSSAFSEGRTKKYTKIHHAGMVWDSSSYSGEYFLKYPEIRHIILTTTRQPTLHRCGQFRYLTYPSWEKFEAILSSSIHVVSRWLDYIHIVGVEHPCTAQLCCSSWFFLMARHRPLPEDARAKI